MEIDLAPLVRALAPLALAAFTAAVPYALVLARRAIGLKLTSQQQASVIASVDSGAQAAYGFVATRGESICDASVQNVAIATGVNHVLANVAPALRALNITPERVHAMVSARFGGLLAADPTVSIMAATDRVAPVAPAGAAVASGQEQASARTESGDVDRKYPVPTRSPERTRSP